MENSTKIALGLGVTGVAVAKYYDSKSKESGDSAQYDKISNISGGVGAISLVIGGILLTTKNHPKARKGLFIGFALLAGVATYVITSIKQKYS